MEATIRQTTAPSVCDECSATISVGAHVVHLGESLIICIGCAEAVRISLTNVLMALKRRLRSRA